MRAQALLPRILLATGLLCTASVHSQQPPPRPAEVPKLTETNRQLGEFTLDNQTFTVMVREQTISPAPGAKSPAALAGLEIRDANANAVYQETFPVSFADGRLLQMLTVSAGVLEGAGGKALVLRFLEDPATAGSNESWQMFGLTDGKLTRYAAPLPLGQGGTAVNGVLTGVMLQGGIGVVPLASTAEALEFRIWAGSFFVDVPVRIDWQHGQWSEAEQCFATEGGSLHPAGCNLRVVLSRQAVTEGAAVTLYTQPEESTYAARQILLRADSSLEFPAARALVKWQNSGDRFTCGFDDLWLRVRIDGAEGWIHSPVDFVALGLPSSGPAQ
jgi:hypothetical protein